MLFFLKIGKKKSLLWSMGNFISIGCHWMSSFVCRKIYGSPQYYTARFSTYSKGRVDKKYVRSNDLLKYFCCVNFSKLYNCYTRVKPQLALCISGCFIVKYVQLKVLLKNYIQNHIFPKHFF